jgi:catechol 2,3-dioxygenase-like lactoylglutathione lyase family enzyme
MARIWAVLLLFSGIALAQASAPFAATGSFFALSVPDLKSSVQWYEQKLGLKVVMLRPMKDGVAVAVLDGGGLIVELIEQSGSAPLSKAAPTIKDITQLQGISKAGVVVDNFESTVASLKSRGVEVAFGPFPAHDDQRANVIVRDNNGNLIQFFGKK